MATTNSREVGRPTTKSPKSLGNRSVPKGLIEFQPDAVEIEKQSVPGGARWTLYTVMALIAATITWAYWAKVDRIVVATGSLITLEPPIVIQPVASSLIREIHVKFGDIVKRNDVLATLDPTLTAADLAKLQSRDESLAASIMRLTAERDGLEFTIAGHESSPAWALELQVFQDRQREFAAKMATFIAEREKLSVQQANNVSEMASLKSRAQILQQYYDKINELFAQKSESLLELWKAEMEKLDADRALEKSQNEREQLLSDLELNSKREEEFVTEWRSKISTDLLAASRERDEVSEELTKARRINELVELRVPNDLPSEEYVVLEIADRSPGSAPKPGESLFKLVAVNAPLEAEVEIQARDIGLLRSDNKCRVKLDAFPYQKHGTLDGTLARISEGAFQKGEPPSTLTMYRGRIQLSDTAKLNNMPEKYRLLPGMTISAEIRVGDRRVIEYFLYPILRYLDSSIREP